MPDEHGLNPSFDIRELEGADYNPRKISAESSARLAESLNLIGCAKPIIARGRRIVAGHQRVKALLSQGLLHAPVFFLSCGTTVYDEIRFNQLHNGTDMDSGDEQATIPAQLNGTRGFVTIDPAQIRGNMRSAGATIRKEIMVLMHRFGPWGACVADQDGRVFHAAQYALACKVLKRPLLAYIVPPEIDARAREFLGASYGTFSYEHLPRQTFIQTFAQLYRLRGKTNENYSPLYEKHVIPWLKKNPGAKVLDFGCGQGDYVKRLTGEGHPILGLELFRRSGAAKTIDVGAVNRMVDRLCLAISHPRAPRFDAVVCDYVLNSVDSQQAEDDVLNCVSAFTRPGGTIFFSGRPLKRVQDQATYKRTVSTKGIGQRRVEFLDENNMTALYRSGSWFFQKFHDRAAVDAICARMGWRQLAYDTSHSTGFQVVVGKEREPADAAIAASLAREFDLPINDKGRTLGRSADVLAAFGLASRPGP
ncbi:MAG: methyltransferase domain-containing protein [Planctomycetes bacterium]|nr:methyltransferase domain-containing protein [Planctomycetota bacterium]